MAILRTFASSVLVATLWKLCSTMASQKKHTVKSVSVDEEENAARSVVLSGDIFVSKVCCLDFLLRTLSIFFLLHMA